jgi:lysine 2,3-aminomutase
METELHELLLKNGEPPGSSSQWDSWRWQLRNAVTKIEELNRIIPLQKPESENLSKIIEKYPFGITPYYLSLIDRKNPADPVRLQCVPSIEEERLYFEVEDDPLGEEKDSVVPGLVHRYPDRVLVTLTNMCPVYCRHCTRKREWAHGKWVRGPQELELIYQYISSHKEIRDVILSGGDPLILSTEKLQIVLGNLKRIPHVEIIRIGTRCPVILPQRITEDLVAVLKQYRPIWVNTHFNHPNEITKESSEACDKLLCAGIPVNNQAVLLKGVNDNVATMTKLCQGLLKIGVRPYYLFQCDPASGAAHFRTSLKKGLEIIKGMRGFTSGLCIPTFVVDGLCGRGKIPLQPNYVVAKEKDYISFMSYKGDVFKYYDPEG